MPSTVDAAGRAIAGLLGYNPGPGIYSRLERAVEAMPENVRVQEIPGLIKRYKDGVPGWELNAVDLDSVVAGRAVVPRSEILAAVKERSPVYTHQEVVLGGRPQRREITEGSDWLSSTTVQPDYQRSASPIGSGVSHGDPHYADYGQGGEDYTEVLLLQPGQSGLGFGSHWSGRGLPPQDQAVAHARFDTHGDALRINELQSDLGIHNRKARETQPVGTGAWSPEVVEDLEARGVPHWFGGENNRLLFVKEDRSLPFPLEDAWADILIKRLALEAARKGHRAIEVASPRAIADKVGGNIYNYEHFYGKVVPGAIERLGRKMGGLAEDTEIAGRYVRPEEPLMGYGEIADRLEDFEGPSVEALRLLRSLEPSGPRPAFGHAPQAAFSRLVRATGLGPNAVGIEGTMLQGVLAESLRRGGMSVDDATVAAGQHMPHLVRLAEEQAAMYASHSRLRDLGDAQERARAIAARRAMQLPGRRYLMSDEMRRRILQEGIPASVAIGIGAEQVLDRLGSESPQPQMR